MANTELACIGGESLCGVLSGTTEKRGQIMESRVIELTDDEICLVLQALGKLPYESVADLIAKIKLQLESKESAEEERMDFDS